MDHPSSSSGQQVFEILVREHADMLMAFLRGLVARHDVVEDLFQETMLVAWRRLGDYDRTRPFGPWLRGIAGNLVKERRRRDAGAALCCEPEIIEALDRRFDDLARQPGDTFADRISRLRTCLGRLPEKLREVIELAYGRGMLLKQVAESVDSNEEAVKKRIQRAREALVQCFNGSGETA